MAIFSTGEISGRQTALRAQAAAVGSDAILLTSADNVYYATGVPLLSEWGRPMWAVLTPDAAVVIGSGIEARSMRDNACHCEVETYGDERNAMEAAIGAAVRHLSSASVVGVEKRALPIAVYERLLEELGGRPIADISVCVERCRLVKSDEELDLLRLGGLVAKIGADAFLSALAGGVTELAVAGAALVAMHGALGAVTAAVPASSYVYCQFGDHTLSPHMHPTGRRLRPGDVVALNVFPVVAGYCVELERTLVFRDGTEEQLALLDVVGEAFRVGKAVYGQGRKMADVHRACTEVIRRTGYSEAVRHGTGHAHGIMIGSAAREELGELREYNDGVLADGMVNSIEPGVYVPGAGGFRHSDVLALSNGGVECLTEFPVDVRLGAERATPSGSGSLPSRWVTARVVGRGHGSRVAGM